MGLLDFWHFVALLLTLLVSSCVGHHCTVILALRFLSCASRSWRLAWHTLLQYFRYVVSRTIVHHMQAEAYAKTVKQLTPTNPPASGRARPSTRSYNMSQCAIGAGAVTVTWARAERGVRFSWPHLHSSLGIMVSTSAQELQFDRWVRDHGRPRGLHSQDVT
jgi:hypothetical protein